MKVAIVLNTSWNIYNFRMGLIKALQQEGNEVVAIAPKDDYSKLLVENGCDFIPVKMDSRGANPIKDMALTLELYKIYKQVRPDVILHYTIKPNIYGTVAASLLRIPVVNNVCGLGTVFLKQGLTSRIAVAMYRIAFRFPKMIFFQNEFDKELFISRKIVRKKITDVIPGSGIDLSRFKSVPLAENGKFTFLMISRLIHDKGVVEYVEAVKQLRSKGVDAKFQILGPKDPQHKRGIQLDIIDEWLKDGVVEYLGTTDDVRGFINNADCIVLPSYREGTPRTLLEAASSGRPIVTTDVPGCNSVVSDNYNGFLCKLKSSDDLADKMYKMSQLNRGKLEEFAENGRRMMEECYSEEVVVNKYIEVLGQINS